ncbi:MAG: hypothetical protein QOJ16_3961 [Acidobacteriota bacterium]|nr:hypothetical protein [Acidobacteriota bacterium]
MERGRVDSRRLRSVVFTLAVGLAVPLVAAAAPSPPPTKVGPEIQVNSFSKGNQLDPAVAAGGDGSFDVVWESDAVAPDHGPGLYGRHFDPAGQPGPEFRIDSGNVLFSLPGRVAADRAGNFVVAWAAHGNPDGSNAVIAVRRFDRTGAPLGGEIPVSTSVWPVHAAADVAMDPSGGFVVSWAVGDLTAQGAVLARLYDAQGQPRSPEITVSEGIDAIGGTRVAIDPRGGFLVAWDQARQFVSTRFYVRRFDAQGAPREAPILVADSQGFRFRRQGIVFPVPAPDGTFAVLWKGYSPSIPAQPSGLFAQRFDATGARGDLVSLHGPFIFDDPPAVAPDPTGGGLVAWSDLAADQTLDVYARSFDASWQPRGEAFTLNTFTSLTQMQPALASSPAGNFFAAWASGQAPPPFGPFNLGNQDGDQFGVFGQRLTVPLAPSVDDSHLSLLGGRFRLTVAWNDPHGPLGTGIGHAVPLTGDTGAFWFFDPANVELIVKLLDGRGINGKFWVFYGALSDVAYDLTVTDTTTGEQRVYHNPALTLASQADTSAFPLGAKLLASNQPGEAPQTVTESFARALPAASTSAAICGPDPAALCLQGARFTVAVAFTDPRTGASGTATAVPLSPESGYFWFFGPANVELVVKVLDGRSLNGNFWVLYGALSDVDYTITVTDVSTGRQRTYHNPLHTLASRADTTAFSDVR